MNKKIILNSISISALSFFACSTYASDLTVYGVKSVSGAFASYGKYADMGSKLAIDDYNATHDDKVNYVTIDSEGNAGVAARKVQEVIGKNKAQLFDGATLSSTALVLSQEINKTNGVFFTPAGADEITGVNCNSSTFRWSVPTYGAIRETVTPLIKKFPEKKRWYTITPKYVFGEALLKNAEEVFKEEGIDHVGNSFHSLKEQEFSGYLANAMSAKPDVLLLLDFGSQSTNALRQAVNFGLKNKMTILVAWSSGLDQLQELGPDVASGVYFGAQYWHTVDTPMNNAFVKHVKDVYGITPNYPMAADYITTKLILDAASKTGDSSGINVSKALEGMTYDGPTGKESIRAHDHQVIKNYYLLEGKKASDMKDKDDYAEVISSGKSFPEESKTLCKR